MITLFDSGTANNILERINGLTQDAPCQWGNMTVSEMLKHCSEGMELAIGTKKMDRVFIGRIIGPFIKKKMLNEAPMERNMPTMKELQIKDTLDFETERRQLLKTVGNFIHAGREGVPAHIHPFFGMMTTEEWGVSAGKHLDHHLRQFGN